MKIALYYSNGQVETIGTNKIQVTKDKVYLSNAILRYDSVSSNWHFNTAKCSKIIRNWDVIM